MIGLLKDPLVANSMNQEVIVKNEESVGAVFVRKSQTKNKSILFLLLQSIRGEWNFPKGHREGVESDMETLGREIQEETGVPRTMYTVWDKLGSMEYTISKNSDPRSRARYATINRPVVIRKKVVFYLGVTKEAKIKISKEHIKYGWYDIVEAKKRLKWNPKLIKMVEAAYDAGLARLV